MQNPNPSMVIHFTLFHFPLENDGFMGLREDLKDEVAGGVLDKRSLSSDNQLIHKEAD